MIKLTIKCSVDDTSGIEAALEACCESLDHVEGYAFAVSDDVSGERRDEIVQMVWKVYEDHDIEIDSDAEIGGDARREDENDDDDVDGYWVAARLYVKVPRAAAKAAVAEYARGYAAGLQEAAKIVSVKSDIIRGMRGGVRRACSELDMTARDLLERASKTPNPPSNSAEIGGDARAQHLQAVAEARGELRDLDAEFYRAGGRGVELADRIDELRRELGDD